MSVEFVPPEQYVTNDAWIAGTARPDTIDEIADQFERPNGAEQFWTDVTVRRADRVARLAPRTIERRAG